MEHEFRSIDPSTAYLDRVGLVAVRARRLDPPVDTEGGTDAERIPGAVGVPPASLRENSVRGRDGRERVRHPDRVPVRLEDEGMRVMEQPPALDDVMLIAELARKRRTAELHEGRVGPIAKGDQICVDLSNLHGLSACAHAREGQPAGVPECAGMSSERAPWAGLDEPSRGLGKYDRPA